MKIVFFLVYFINIAVTLIMIHVSMHLYMPDGYNQLCKYTCIFLPNSMYYV